MHRCCPWYVEGIYEHGRWQPERRLNGGERHRIFQMNRLTACRLRSQPGPDTEFFANSSVRSAVDILVSCGILMINEYDIGDEK